MLSGSVGHPATGTSDSLRHDLLRWRDGVWQQFPGACQGFGSAMVAAKGIVHALAVHGSHLYVGGQLRRAGGRPVENFARWRLR
jgi:hypothetical protein